MKIILLSIITFFIVNSISAQDYILTKDGKKYEAKIVGEDSTFFYFTIVRGENEIKTSINKNNVETIIYEDQKRNSSHNPSFIDPIDKIKSDFIYLNSGKIIEATKVEYKEPFFGKNYFAANNLEYKVEDVKFYKSKDVFFANIESAEPNLGNRFAKREIAGKINLFAYNRNLYNPYAPYSAVGSYGVGTGNVTVGVSGSPALLYYNKGFGDVKKVNYQNLYDDVNDNPISLHYLEQYRNAATIKTVCGVAGTVFFIAGCIALSNQVKSVNNGETDKQQNYGATYALFGSSIISYSVGIGFHFTKKKMLKLTILSYN